MISVVVPAYNEAGALGELYRRLTLVAGGWNEDYEVIVVDDGSGDGTLAALQELAARDRRVKVISLSRNFGHQAAVSAGLAHAVGSMVAVIDADLQDPPEELARFLNKCREGYDVVYAVRTKRKESLSKRAAYHAYYRLLRMFANIDIPLDSGDFCVMSRRALDALNSLPERARFIRGLRTWIGYRQTGLGYERQARVSGRSKYTLRRLVGLALDGVVGFSSLPLRLLGLTGIAIGALALLAAALFLFQYFSGVTILGYNPRQAQGWTSLILTILFLSAIQLFGLGVIGEYLGKLFEEAKGRPTYIIATTINLPAAGQAAPRE